MAPPALHVQQGILGNDHGTMGVDSPFFVSDLSQKTKHTHCCISSSRQVMQFSCHSEISPCIKFNILVCIICSTRRHVKNEFQHLRCSLNLLACKPGKVDWQDPRMLLKKTIKLVQFLETNPGNVWMQGLWKEELSFRCRRTKRICWVLERGTCRWAGVIRTAFSH